MKKALVLAGGVPQIELIKELQSRDYFVLLADYFENPVAKPYADKFFRKSTLDVNAIRKIAVDEQVDLLVTCCTDQALETVSRLCEELQLPCYVSAEIGLAVTNKRFMKKKFAENQIPTAEYQVIRDINELKLLNMPYPLIVKPADCNSSKGVIRVTDSAELNQAVVAALQLSRTSTAIVEQFIDGIEISVDLVVSEKNAKIICYSFSDKIPDKEKFVIWKNQYRQDLSDEILNKIEVAAQKIVDAFELDNCPMLIQLLLKDTEIYVVEFSARTGGCIKYHLINLASGIDIIKSTVDAFEGKKIQVNPNFADKIISDEFIYCAKGKFESLEGFEECLEKGVIESVFLLKNPGERFDKVENSGDRVAAITIVADSNDDYIKKHNYVANHVHVLDSEGNDMMRHDLFMVMKK